MASDKARAEPARSSTRDILIFEGVNSPSYWKKFAALLAISVIIATLGLYRNSAAVVIAAMLIAPLMTPILGIAGAMIVGWIARAARLVAMVMIAALGAVAIAFLLVFLGDAPEGLRLPEEVLARTDPGIEELLVALAAGTAGAYVQVNRSEASLVPGAAIGVALVPPLSATGILLYFSRWEGAYEAFLLFFTNLVAIVLSAFAVYALMGYMPSSTKRAEQRRRKPKRQTVGMATTLLIVGALALPLGHTTWSRFKEARLEELALVDVRKWAQGSSVEVARLDINHRSNPPLLDLWLIVDVPIAAARTLIPVADSVPDHLTYSALVLRLRGTFGEEYDMALRINPRFSNLVDLKTTQREVVPPPRIEQGTDSPAEPEDDPEPENDGQR